MKKPRPITDDAPDITSKHGDGQRLGINETSVREVLAKATKPLSAYDIISILTKRLGRPIAPTTVYRALKNLTEDNSITKIESANAYTLCQHPHEAHDCLFFVCHSCGDVEEAPHQAVSKLLRQESKMLSFAIDRPILEIVGRCKTCTGLKS